LSSRPGSRVLLPPHHPGADRAAVCRGVVCDPLDGTTVNVLGTSGRKRACHLQELILENGPRPVDLPLQVGDFARASASSGRVASSCPGMVVASDGSRACLRLRAGGTDRSLPCEDHCSGSCRDFWFPLSEVHRDEAADLVRPGAAVRLRDRDAQAPLLPAKAWRRDAAGLPPVGVVYAVHADATAVVDFLGAFGCRCGVELLEAVEHPTTVDHSVLKVLSECLSWCEVSAQQADEREAALLRRLAPQGPARPRTGPS